MKSQIATTEFERRFSCANTKKADSEKLTSEELEQQIAAFLQQGGRISPIPTGFSAKAPGAVIVSEEPHSMGTPRPSKTPRKTRAITADESPFVSLKQAAKMLGITQSAMTRKVQKGDISIAAQHAETGEKLVRITAVQQIKKYMTTRSAT